MGSSEAAARYCSRRGRIQQHSDLQEQYPSRAAVALAGFQVVVELAQLSLLQDQEKPTNASAIAFLKEVRQLNEGRWLACHAAVLHQLLAGYLKKGPLLFQEAPMRSLMVLLSGACLAKSFLDSAILCSELHGTSRTVIGAAFGLFEYGYSAQPLAVLEACVAKLVNRSSENASVRLECLSVLTRIHKAQSEVPSEFTKAVLKCVLQDGSIRVRRSAMQLLSLIRPTKRDEEEVLSALLLKLRDQDDKIRGQALDTLSKFPMESLASLLKDGQWKFLFESTLSAKEDSQVYRRAEELFILYLTSDKLRGPPSARLRTLDFANEGKAGLFSSCLNKHIQVVFDEELKYL